MILKDGVKIAVPQEFIKEYVDKGKTMVFLPHPSQCGVDPKTKQLTYRRGTNVECFFTRFEKGKEVEYRYATSIPKGVVADSYPSYITFEGRTMPSHGSGYLKADLVCDLRKKDDIDKAYFLFIHNRNASSENFDNSKQPIFYLQDLAKTAREKMKIEENEYRAHHMIVSDWAEETLREAAYAFDITGIDDMEKEQVQLALINVAKKNPAAFLDKALKSDFEFLSRISHGVSKHVVYFKENAWYWGEDSNRPNTEIVKVKPGDDSRTGLLKFFNRATDEKDYFLDKVNGVSKKKVVEAKRNVTVEE